MDADRSSPDPWATGRRRSGRPDRGVRRATPPRYDDAGPGPAGRGAPASGTPAPGNVRPDTYTGIHTQWGVPRSENSNKILRLATRALASTDATRANPAPAFTTTCVDGNWNPSKDRGRPIERKRPENLLGAFHREDLSLLGAPGSGTSASNEWVATAKVHQQCPDRCKLGSTPTQGLGFRRKLYVGK